MSEQAETRNTSAVPPSDAAAISEEINPDLTQIDAYAKVKQIIARDLHYLRELLHQRNSERRDGRCQVLMAKLAEDHFTLAVLGQFKRGKSSLMNAIIGHPLLPTGVLPLTSAITVLKFGPHERLLIEHEESSIIDEAPLAKLSDYVTERGNPGNRRRIARAVIEMPSPFLRRGLEFVDTPGVGSAIEANTAITQHFLPQCDAVIFITSVDSPLSQTELEFLSQIREHVRKIFFVVNKTDLLGADEHKDVLQFIEQNLRSIMGTASIRLFPLSCQRGLEAKVQGDLDGYARSGVKGFEETLSEFLSTAKMSAFLVSILDRVIAIADEELREMALEARATAMSADEAEEHHRALQQRFDQLRASREDDLSAIRERLRAFVEESAKREVHVLAQQAAETFRQHVHEATGRHPWQLAHGVIREWRHDSEQRLQHAIQGWATTLADHLWPLVETSARQELQPLFVRCQKIPHAAAELLHIDAAPPAATEELENLHLERELRMRFPAKKLTAQHPAWPSPIPARFSVLPVCWVHDALTDYCHQAIEQMVGIAEVAICTAMGASSDEALANTFTRFRQRAEEIEQRVEAVIVGNVPASSNPTNGAHLAQHSERLQQLHARMHSLRDHLLLAQAPEAEGIVSLVPHVEVEMPQEDVTPPAPAPMRNDTDIARDMTTRGCPVCNHAYRVIFDFFAHWQYELYQGEVSQRRFAAEGGLCRVHTWQLATIASPQGVCQGYPRLVDRLAGEIARLAAENDHLAESVWSLLPNAQHCRACHVVHTAETEYLARFATFLQDSEGITAYRRSQGLCLRHLALLLEGKLVPEIKRALLRHTSRILSATSEDMQNYALKRDALRRDLYNKDDDDAYLRALIRLAGTRYLAVPWSRDEGEV